MQLSKQISPFLSRSLLNTSYSMLLFSCCGKYTAEKYPKMLRIVSAYDYVYDKTLVLIINNYSLPLNKLWLYTHRKTPMGSCFAPLNNRTRL